MSDLIKAQIHISNFQALRHNFVMSEVQANTVSSQIPTKVPQYPCHPGCFGVALKCLLVTLGSRFWIRWTQVLCKILEPFILVLITALVPAPGALSQLFRRCVIFLPLYYPHIILILPYQYLYCGSIYISKH